MSLLDNMDSIEYNNVMCAEQPPKLVGTPIIYFRDGKAIVEYCLSELGENTDETEISWYRVDKIDRSNYNDANAMRRSNERDSRKIAVSRNGEPCKEIRLTAADIGKHIKVNIKPKHNKSEVGQGLNIFSAIVKSTDVIKDRIILNPKAVVVREDYDMEPGYFTVRGQMESGVCFGRAKRPGLITESTGCGIYYNYEGDVKDMSLVVMLEPEDITGNGLAGLYQYEDVYIKYNPVTNNGYGLRIEGVEGNEGKVKFCLYQFKNGNGTPVSNEYLSDAYKPGCEINLRVKNNMLNAFISYDDGENFSEVELRARVRENTYGGFGFKHMAKTTDGGRACLKYMEAEYENGMNNI